METTMNTAGIEGLYIHCFQGLAVNKTMSTDQIIQPVEFFTVHRRDKTDKSGN